MYSKSDNIEIMINGEAAEVMKEPFESIKNRYQNNLVSIKGSEFVFDYIPLLYYKYHKINRNRGGSYIDSQDWAKSKKATINTIKKKDIDIRLVLFEISQAHYCQKTQPW